MNNLEPEIPLRVLDPEGTDPGYWERFHARSLRRAEAELVRRRRARFTVESQLMSWGRAILPVAAAAAAVAFAILAVDGPPSSTETFAGLEDVIDVSIDGEPPLPYFLHSDQEVDRDAVLFAVERF